MKISILFISILLFLNCKSQDISGLASFKIDTITLNQFNSTQIVVYKYHDVRNILDFDAVKAELTKLTEGIYHTSIAKQMLSKIVAENGHGDTAYLDQENFDKISWAPFDGFLCDYIEKRECLIMDLQGNICTSIIRVHGVRKSDKYYYWGGILYFLPGRKDWFKECTEWES